MEKRFIDKKIKKKNLKLNGKLKEVFDLVFDGN